MNWFKSLWKQLTAPPGVPVRPLRLATPTGAQTPIQPSAAGGPSVPSMRSEETLPNFSPRAQQVLALARKEAKTLKHNFVGTEHLLLAFATFGQGTAASVLTKMGVQFDTVRAELVKALGAGPDQKIIGNIPFTPRVKKVLALAVKESRALRHDYVGTGHILLGLLREGDGIAARILKNLNVELEPARQMLLKEIDPNYTPPPPAEKSPMQTNPAPAKPVRAPVDTTLRYDIYCVERNQKVVVYRNVLIKAARALFPRNDYDHFSDFIEFEQADGQTVFVSKSSIIRFCQFGVKPEPEDLSGPEK
jgi:hypothetical protein